VKPYCGGQIMKTIATKFHGFALISILAFIASISSCSGSGGGGASSDALTAPAAPSGLTATAVSSAGINLTWTDASDSENGFKVERSVDGATFTEAGTTATNTATFSDTGLTASTKYYYRVCARNSAGDSPYSNIAAATTQAPALTVPVAPSGLSATAVSSTGINVSWTDNSDNEDGYKIERSIDGTSFTQIGTTTANTTSYPDSGLSASTSYYYRVRAYNAAGSSSYDSTASATTQAHPLAVPSAPTNLTATTVSSSRVNLTWTDNATNEDGFILERSADNVTYAALATINTNSTQYSDTGLTASTTYYYRVKAHNAAGNSGYSNVASQTTMAAPPVVYFVDAPVVWNGADMPITVYAANVTSTITKVALVPTGQSSPVTDLSSSITTDGGHPNRAKAVVPASTSAGTYDVIVEDVNASPGALASGLLIVDNVSFPITRVNPPFGYNGTDHSITIVSPGAFIAAPKAYIVPHGGGTAMPISTAYTDSSTLTAIVPSGLAGGTYDVVVVNPDGTAGVLSDGFKVTTSPSPQITKVTPSSIVAATGQVIVVSGKNFSGSSVSLSSCREAAGSSIPSPMMTASTGTCTGAGCSQGATIDGSTLSAGSLCVLRLTNSDGSYADYSAIGVTNPALNLNSPHTGTNMIVGRRALAAASSNADARSRFVYAIGGDDGAAVTPTVYDSVEFAPVDQFGNMGQWSLLPRSALNTPRAFASSSVIGRYIYVAGGNDGTGAINSAERAMILSPTEAPQLALDDLHLEDVGLDAGYWHYRVSAVFSAVDPDNPNGESLPSNEIVALTSYFPGKKIQALLSWSAPKDALGTVLPNVTGYNIYRTPTANGMPGAEVLIATVGSGTFSYLDNGTSVPGVQSPLPPGSLGKWKTLPAMSASRRGAAGAAAVDPADATVFYIYTLLGLNQAGTALGSYEYLPVTILPNGHQTVGSSWTSGTNSSVTGRWQLNAWVADSTVSSNITATSTYVYLGGGTLANGTLTGKVESGLVNAGGDLGVLSDAPKDITSPIAGYGVCAANDQLFAFGGGNAAPTSGAKVATLTPPSTLAANSWNPEGIALTHARYLMGSSVQNSFIFLIGGQTDEPSLASKTTEVIVW
jgi:fibronectin type III domain protein